MALLGSLQEMEYLLPGEETYTSPVGDRFSGDWVALHLMSPVCRLTDQRSASYNFLKNGGMTFANSIGA